MVTLVMYVYSIDHIQDFVKANMKRCLEKYGLSWHHETSKYFKPWPIINIRQYSQYVKYRIEGDLELIHSTAINEKIKWTI